MTQQCTTVNVEDEQVVVTADCDELALALVDSEVIVEIADIGLRGEPGVGGLWGTIFGDILLQADLQNQFATKLDKTGGQIQNYSEGNEDLPFTAGASTLPVDTCKNVQWLALTQNSAITTSGISPESKPITLMVTHITIPCTLSWNGTDLELEGVGGETESVLLVWKNSTWIVNRGGVVDLTI